MRVYFIGIGGIGISALAQYYLAQGHEVFGSDLINSEITEMLKKLGAKITIGKHKSRNVPKNIDLFIYTPAISKNNPELKWSIVNSQKSKVRILSYPQALGELTKKYFTIAVSGTHGKSTVSSMIALMMEKAGLDPTVIIGTKLREFGNTNFKMGSQQSTVNSQRSFLVIEADEYAASFLNYSPKIIVLTNIEAEHLDYYGNLSNILKTFQKYISQLPRGGALILNEEDENIRKLKVSPKISVLKYQLKKSKDAKKIRKILKIPGKHNISNALAVLTLARFLKISDSICFEALSKYQGSWRRFEIIEANLRGCQRGLTRKITIVSDYAHHPTEIKATLLGARQKWPEKKIWLVYQPHQYQRTFYLFNEFIRAFCFAPVDKVIFVPVFDVAGRENEKLKKKASSEKLYQAVKEEINNREQEKEIIYIGDTANVQGYLKENLKGGEIVFFMGAGDVYKLCDGFST